MANRAQIEVVAAVVELLTPLEPEERIRVANAALSLLGSPTVSGEVRANRTASTVESDVGDLPPRAQSWMKQNDITADQLSQVFQIGNGDVEIITAEVPGKNAKEQTYNAYVLVGIGRLLASGSPVFDDKSARAFCKLAGCLNEANHSAYLASKGNEFTGSKEKGWTLTAPGLKRGASLIKELSGNGS